MLRPFVLIGVGGSGGKTLRIVRHELERRLQDVGWQGAFPAGWQLLHIDVPSLADGDDPGLPKQLPLADYAGLVGSGINYQNIDRALAGEGRTHRGDAIAGWRPDRSQVTVPVEKGAGQFRALGRMITLANLAKVKAKLDDALRAVSGQQVNAELQEVTRRLGRRPLPVLKSPIVVVVSSIAGGSGAGALIDVCDVLRASGQEWAKESIGLLYAPDVFDYLKAERRRGVRPNALATLSELTAGYWNKEGTTPETATILESQGIAVGDATRLGPRTSFLVGSRNDFVTYQTQNDIYHAMGRSLASWVTSAVLQDRLDAYVSGNWASTAISVPDELPLKTNDMETPYTAMGSSRVSLGRDRFRDFAAQRLARAAVERVLHRHMQLRAPGDDRSATLVAQEVADGRFAAFLSDSRLNERTDHNNDILDALRPPTHQEHLKGLASRIRGRVTDNVTKPLSVEGWRGQIVTAVREVIDRELDEFEVELRERARAWVSSVQDDLRKLAASYLAMEGYEVTDRLFAKLVNELRAVRSELEQEAALNTAWGDKLDAMVLQMLQNGGDSLLPADSEYVSSAVKNGVGAIHYLAEARLRTFVAALLPDFVDNAIVPVTEEIRRAGEALKRDYAPSHGMPSVVETWPRGDDVPAVLQPPANELLLEDPGTFAASLHEIIGRTVGRSDRDGAFNQVLRDIVAGVDPTTSDEPTLVEQPAAWVPRSHEIHHVELSTPQRAAYSIDLSAQSIHRRALDWLERRGTAAGSFVREGLARYLDPADSTLLESRLARFEQQLTAAVDAAQPLVGISKNVLVAVHQRHEVRTETIFSEFPVAERSRAGQVIRHVLESKDLWNPEMTGLFTDGDGAAVDAFAVLAEPYEPVVFDSLMRPIAEEWRNRSKTADGREEFWRWRRSRSLPEFVPAAPHVRKAMVRGWFTASLLGQLELSAERTGVFVPGGQGGPGLVGWFPMPLLATGVPAPYDYLPLALESLPLALMDVNVTAKLDAVAPYRRLRQLGTSGGGGLDSYDRLAPELAVWIEDGRLPLSAPTPAPRHAGRATGTWTDRRDALVVRVEELGNSYEKLFAETEQRERQSVPRAYELRRDIRSTLSELAEAVRRYDVESEEDSSWN